MIATDQEKIHKGWRGVAAQQADGADRASKRKAGGDRRSEAYRTKVDTQQNDVNLDQPDGNSRATALRRLRKDRLDLHARVMAGTPIPDRVSVITPEG